MIFSLQRSLVSAPADSDSGLVCRLWQDHWAEDRASPHPNRPYLTAAVEVYHLSMDSALVLCLHLQTHSMETVYFADFDQRTVDNLCLHVEMICVVQEAVRGTDYRQCMGLGKAARVHLSGCRLRDLGNGCSTRWQP